MSVLDELTDKIKHDIATESHAIEVHDIIKQIIAEKWNGKMINKRLATQIKERLTELYGKEPVIYYGTDYGMYQIKIWGTPHWPNYDQGVQFFMGHQNTATPLSPEFFEDKDCCHGEPAKERNRRRQVLLDSKDELKAIAKQIEVCRTAYAKLQELTGEFGSPAWEIRYEAERLTGLEQKR